MKINSNPSPIKRSRDVTDINRTSSLRHRFTIIISANVHCTPVVGVFGNRGNGRCIRFVHFPQSNFLRVECEKTWKLKKLSFLLVAAWYTWTRYCIFIIRSVCEWWGSLGQRQCDTMRCDAMLAMLSRLRRANGKRFSGRRKGVKWR